MMSAEKQEVNPELSLLDQLKGQHQQFIAQRDFTQNNLNQLIGAIFACEMMIKKHEEEVKKGDQDNGQADEQDQKQAA
jgi:hypothetical protein